MTRLSPEELDLKIQVLDRRHLMACVNHAPAKTVQAIVTARNALVRELGQTWRTETVA